ncbi:MAG: hypothetical protein AMJ79_14600 [Phycisphaerae bacterium SM23_30]|nr:MAG: hypothetical protein AMJ79_14600 [Phycisphaerae bacterium SM23_30]
MKGENMENQSFFFIQITDPQFGMFTANADFDQEAVLFEKAIAQVNRLGPEFLIITGDLINEPGDEEQTTAVLHIAGKIDPGIKLFHIPGNHDIGDAPTVKMLNWYRQRISKDWYSFDVGSWHFVALNSCIIFNGENAPQEVQKQWEWLNQDLRQSRIHSADRIMVFMHHSLFLEDPEEPGDGYFNIPEPTRRVYLDLFHQFGVQAVMAGHRHINFLAAAGSMEMITTAPVGMPLAEDPSGFRIVKIHGNRLVHQYFGLDNLPEHIELPISQ